MDGMTATAIRQMLWRLRSRMTEPATVREWARQVQAERGQTREPEAHEVARLKTYLRQAAKVGYVRELMEAEPVKPTKGGKRKRGDKPPPQTKEGSTWGAVRCRPL